MFPIILFWTVAGFLDRQTSGLENLSNPIRGLKLHTDLIIIICEAFLRHANFLQRSVSTAGDEDSGRRFVNIIP